MPRGADELRSGRCGDVPVKKSHSRSARFRFPLFRFSLLLCPMPGVGTLLKQAQKMQRSIESLQTQLDAKEIDVAAGGGAIKVKISASGKFLSLALDPEFLKEEPKVVADTMLAAVHDAAKQAKDYHDAEMKKVTSALQVPGLF